MVSSPCLCSNPIPAPSTSSPSCLPLSLAIPMASAVTDRRQLAPTVGQTEASTGVKIRTGSSSSSGERHASSLILRRGAIDYVVDFSARHGFGVPLPPGVSLQVGTHRIFISSFPEAYPREMRVFSCITDPLSTRGCEAAPGGGGGRVRASVMMAGASSSSNQGTPGAARKAKETADAAEGVGTSTLRDILYTPVNMAGNPEQIHANLEKARLILAGDAEHVLAEKRRLELITREYNAAHAIARKPIVPAVLEGLRSRGRAVHQQLSGQEQPARPVQPAQPVQSMFIQMPAYSTPDKNLRAAEQIAMELEDLEGDELRQQTRRMRELLTAAKEQQLAAMEQPAVRPEMSRGTVRPIPGASQRPIASRQNRQNSAPSRRESNVKSNRTQPAASRRIEEPAVYSRRNDMPQQSAAKPAISARLGPRQIGRDDARHRIELLEKEAQEDEEGEAGPLCFGHRIRTEKFPKGFTLPIDTPKYNGAVKPEDWLSDYLTAVRIAGGNRRVAVRYAPLMLQGSARTWLNSLPKDSINCWEDFTSAFTHNFTRTYDRPNLPRQLALCVQGKDEPLRDYLSRWIKLKNSCEGVHEIQSIQYFIDGCLADSILKHKLLRKNFTSQAAVTRVANEFAVSDSTMRPIQLEAGGVIRSPGAPQSDTGNQGLSRKERRENRNNSGNQQSGGKRKDEQPDAQYGSRQVAAVQNEEASGAAGGSRRPRPNVRPPGQMKPKYTLEDVLDAPCKLHSTPGRPSAHTTRQCDFVRRIAKGEALPPPPPLPPQNRGPPQQQNQFPRQDAAYMIFTSESVDKGSRRARVQEVNATMLPVPQYLHWSDCEVSWSRADHPAILPNPGNYPLVVDPLFAGPKFACTFSRVLVDGGSTINILYRDTLTKLGLTERDLERSRTTFHGIVPWLS